MLKQKVCCVVTPIHGSRKVYVCPICRKGYMRSKQGEEWGSWIHVANNASEDAVRQRIRHKNNNQTLKQLGFKSVDSLVTWLNGLSLSEFRRLAQTIRMLDSG